MIELIENIVCLVTYTVLYIYVSVYVLDMIAIFILITENVGYSHLEAAGASRVPHKI